MPIENVGPGGVRRRGGVIANDAVNDISPAYIDTDDGSGNMVIAGADGNSLVTFDANGNIAAHVNHRTGALDTLLALEGGVGEISVATDVDAIVVHNGVALEAKAFYRSSKIAELHIHGTIASLVGGTASVVDLTSTTVNYGDMLVDLANNKFQPPKGTLYAKGTIYVTVTDTDVTAGTKFTAYADYYVPGLGWSNLIGQEVITATSQIQASGDTVVMQGVTIGSLGPTFDRSPAADEGYIQLRILHNDATDTYSTVSVSAVFEFFGAN